MSDAFIPEKKQRKFIRPLNKGIRNDLPSTQLPDGAFTDIDGFIAQPYGLRRRPATSRFGTWEVDYAPIQGLWTVRAVTGASYSVIMDNKKIYIIRTGTRTAIDWTYEVGTVTEGDTAYDLVGSGTSWSTGQNWILAGDRIFVTGETGDTTETNANDVAIKTYIIAAVTDDTNIVLETPLVNAPSGATYVIYRSVGASAIATPVNVNDTLYFADGQRPIQTVTNNPANAWGLLNNDNWCPYTVAYHGDRLWAADIRDPEDDLGGGIDLRYRQRIAWSNLGVGNLGTFTATDFLQLPYGFGAVRRLMPMSQFLIAYLTDSIWFGQQSNLPSLPLQFTKFETGGMGLVTPKAVTAYLDGHFFIGQDDVYFVSQRGVQPVGTPVVKDMLATVSSEASVRAVTDYSTSTVVFGIPTSGNQISQLWRFNVKTKGWSNEVRETNFIQTDTILETISWDNLSANIAPDTWPGFGTYFASWNTILTEVAWNQQLFFNSGDRLFYYQDDSGLLDADTGQVPTGKVITGDLDFESPDITKTFTSFSLELESPLNASDDSLNIVLSGSVDKGKNWKDLGTLVIPAEQDEDEVNFRITGAHVRFRLVPQAAENHTPYTLGGFGIVFALVGDEVQGR